MWQISGDFVKEGITAPRWELEVLTRGATFHCKGKSFCYPALDIWTGFEMNDVNCCDDG
ncbi:replication A protein [Hafnia alvei]|nr:replication A protein [Hafnia alvei]